MICSVCGAEYPDDWPKPIHCPHTKSGKIVQSPIKTTNPWVLIHTRLANAIKAGQWDSAAEQAWYQLEFKPLIPTSCCRDNWSPIEAQLDWSTAEAAFKSWWWAHNEVSSKHSNKPTMTYRDCCKLYEVY